MADKVSDSGEKSFDVFLGVTYEGIAPAMHQTPKFTGLMIMVNNQLLLQIGIIWR
jgi:hypothetical protein